MHLYCMDPRHYRLVSELLATQQHTSHELNRRHANSERLSCRIEQLGLAAWQHTVRSLLYEYVHAAGAVAPGLSRGTYSLAVSSLVKYEHMERVSLIEMAAWKHSCIMALDDDDSNTGNEQQQQQSPRETMSSFLDVKAWERHGWKAIKMTMRRFEATNVIVQCVLPYLDQDPTSNGSSATTTSSNKKRRMTNNTNYSSHSVPPGF
jgi:hypothetical protein